MSRKRQQPNPPTCEKTLDFKQNQAEAEKEKTCMKNQLDIENRKIARVKKQNAEDPKVLSNEVSIEQAEKKEEKLKQNVEQEKPAQPKKQSHLANQQQQPDQKVQYGSQNKETNPNNPASPDKQQQVREQTQQKKEPGQYKANQLKKWNEKVLEGKKEIKQSFGIFTQSNTPMTPLPRQNLFKFSTQFFNTLATPLCFQNKKSDVKSFFSEMSVVKEFVSKAKQQKSSEKQENEDQGQDSKQLQKQQQLAENPLNSTGNYDYSKEPTYFSYPALKIKTPNNEIVEDIELQIQNNATKKMYWITVFLSKTKVAILSGYIVKDKTKIGNLGGKAENVAFSILVKKKEAKILNLNSDIEPTEVKIQVLKIQFERPEMGEKFVKAVEEILNAL